MALDDKKAEEIREKLERKEQKKKKKMKVSGKSVFNLRKIIKKRTQ